MASSREERMRAEQKLREKLRGQGVPVPEPNALKNFLSSPAARQAWDVYQRALRTQQAAVSGAVDEFTFGAADHLLSGFDAMRGGDYRASMEARRAQDAYDAAHHAVARNVGRAAGLGAGMVAMGGAGRIAAGAAAGRLAPAGLKRAAALVAKAPRLKRGPDPRGLASLAVKGGATAGLGGQAVGDVLCWELSTPGDYAGAALGGAIGGLAILRGGPLRGALVEGATTSIAQDALNGRAPDIGDAIGSGHAAAALGGLTGAGGTYGSAAASRQVKEKLGEAMSVAKAKARSRPITGTQKYREVKKGAKTRADFILRNDFVPLFSGEEILESKFGAMADLTRRQKEAAEKFGRRYIIDAWNYRDAGKAAAAVGAPMGHHVARRDREPNR